MAKDNNLGDYLKGIADTIRTKKGTEADINAQDFESEIASITTYKEEEQRTINSPSFAGGDIEVTPTVVGKVMTKVTIAKDNTNHKPANILDGVTLYGIEGNLQPQKPEQQKSKQPNFASGNDEILPDSGKVLSKVTIEKDTTNHKATNIKDGVTLYGIQGTMEEKKIEETKSLEPDFVLGNLDVSGNVVVEPTSGKVLSKVTIEKDSDLVAGNIKDGVTVFGVEGSLLEQKEEEEKTISSPSFASGNIVVEPTSGKVMKKVTLNKDNTNHITGNIKSGVTLYGVGGSLQPAKEEETKTISNADFSGGNLVVNPTANKVMTKVTVNKDANLVAGNIKKDTSVFGVTGTLESGGGADLSKICMICFSLYTAKTAISNTLTYSIETSMLDKTFFADDSNNFYLPSQVDVYFNSTYKGKANTNITLFTGSSSQSGQQITFKVGSTPVGILLYFYRGDDDAFSTGIGTQGKITIKWSTTTTGNIVAPSIPISFIELGADFFDDFPLYNDLNYWKKDSFYQVVEDNYFSRHKIEFGWRAYDPD